MSGDYVSTTNPCRMCRPLGACLAFRGVENSMVLLHGSQGCSTYMRRYISSHFNEPVDIASSSLSEKSAVYGGAANLKEGIRNVVEKYDPAVLGVATTCLTETIGDNVGAIITELLTEQPDLARVNIIPVSTPSYTGDHTDGFLDSCRAILATATAGRERSTAARGVKTGAFIAGSTGVINLFPGILSPADVRHLGEIMDDFQTPSIIMPDYSRTLDGGIGEVFQRIPAGGTGIERLAESPESAFSIEFSLTSPAGQSCAGFLGDVYDVKGERLAIPIGIRNSDSFFRALADMTLQEIPSKYQEERSRLLDAMVDAHKYLFGRKVAIFGDPELVLALASFAADVGLAPVVCASGGGNEEFVRRLEQITAASAQVDSKTVILKQSDFEEIGRHAEAAGVELLIGSSKGNHLSRRLGIPLLRVGFPIHDRFGGLRILLVGYRGSLSLLDILTNIVIKTYEDRPGYGYSYI